MRKISLPLMGMAIGLSLATMFSACGKKFSSSLSSAESSRHQRYQCAMHPQIVRDQPGDCPICGMRLVPLEESMAVSTMTLSKDQGNVHVSESREQSIGVKVIVVEKRDLMQTIRASARVAYDPALYSAILEHQQVVSARDHLSHDANPEFVQEAEATVRASTLRLRQLGLSSEQIHKLVHSKANPANLLLGEPGGTVWVYADLYDYEVGQVKAGQEVQLTSPAFPGQTFLGHVRGIDSILNTETRTLRARIEVPNPRGDFKPDMFLNATIHASLGHLLAVPETAVMDTGDRKLAYVALGDGHYQPREVRLGRQAEGYDEVLSGLAEGDRVVASANFFIDSESKIRSAIDGVRP